MIQSPSLLGPLDRPAAALVFHYAKFASRHTFMPCECVYLGVPGSSKSQQNAIKNINVLVSPSNYLQMKACYERVPGIKVHRFKIRESDLTISMMLSLMNIDQGDSTPLYMAMVTKILRDLAAKSPVFSYREFIRQLKLLPLTPLQLQPLTLRLDLLHSFLDFEGQSNAFHFEPGSMTIIDLSCPFVDENLACLLFDICLGLFIDNPTSSRGKVVALDEAHKVRFLNHRQEDVLKLIVYDQHYRCKDIHRILVKCNPSTETLWHSYHHQYTRTNNLAQTLRPVISEHRS